MRPAPGGAESDCAPDRRLDDRLSGFLIVDKPTGLTSQQVVTRVKRQLGIRKAGHAGTLDPLATGVLVVGLGQATRLLGYAAGSHKQYVTTIRLGQATTTDDSQGDPLGALVDATGITAADLTAAMAQLTGSLQQRPSAVSAVKVGGKRAYDLVRAGADVELAPRSITVSSFTLQRRTDQPPWVDIEAVVDCSTGTYVRALARDLGQLLGVGGHVTALRRTRVGCFGVDQAVELATVDRRAVIALAEVVEKLFPAVVVDAAQAEALRFGRAVPVAVGEDLTALMSEGEAVALCRPDPDRSGWARPVLVWRGDLSD